MEPITLVHIYSNASQSLPRLPSILSESFKFGRTARWNIIHFMRTTRWPTCQTVTTSTPREFQQLGTKWHTLFMQFVMQYFKRGSYSRLPRYVTRCSGGWVTNRRCQYVLTLNVTRSFKTATIAASCYPSRENSERNVHTLPTFVEGQSNQINVVTALWTWHASRRFSIPGMGKRLFSYSQRQYIVWGSPAFILN